MYFWVTATSHGTIQSISLIALKKWTYWSEKYDTPLLYGIQTWMCRESVVLSVREVFHHTCLLSGEVWSSYNTDGGLSLQIILFYLSRQTQDALVLKFNSKDLRMAYPQALSIILTGVLHNTLQMKICIPAALWEWKSNSKDLLCRKSILGNVIQT